ncbi:MAG: hypothetical protein INR68_00770 [Methylobacterium mesophilicum]|nr:hypothetical protein [Methylobacterium mesophilicum]
MLFRDDLAFLSEAVGRDATLTVACMAHDSAADDFANLVLRKIPRDLPQALDWARDDYNLLFALT